MDYNAIQTSARSSGPISPDGTAGTKMPHQVRTATFSSNLSSSYAPRQRQHTSSGHPQINLPSSFSPSSRGRWGGSPTGSTRWRKRSMPPILVPPSRLPPQGRWDACGHPSPSSPPPLSMRPLLQTASHAAPHISTRPCMLLLCQPDGLPRRSKHKPQNLAHTPQCNTHTPNNNKANSFCHTVTIDLAQPSNRETTNAKPWVRPRAVGALHACPRRLCSQRPASLQQPAQECLW
jgi:hypothetical protein